ncbi:hypothetical protein EDE15_3969 [Edaphobacter aggregans]|jgi:hypothetical protein|uniref:Uncharacterized protein n=1 Tax=Edaphobacter aggregans TaxID=570835 RepID=A0A428MNF9_9BACT|nr:hypothetical protein EDE15_3969 [Edaphobacter aggregans]
MSVPKGLEMADLRLRAVQIDHVFGKWPYNRLSGKVLVTLVAAAMCPVSRLFVHVESPPLEISEH